MKANLIGQNFEEILVCVDVNSEALYKRRNNNDMALTFKLLDDKDKLEMSKLLSF